MKKRIVGTLLALTLIATSIGQTPMVYAQSEVQTQTEQQDSEATPLTDDTQGVVNEQPTVEAGQDEQPAADEGQTEQPAVDAGQENQQSEDASEVQTTVDENAINVQAEGDESQPKELVPSIEYQAHVQKIGWQDAVRDGATAGTSGKAYRMEALKINLLNAGEGSAIEYATHVQSIGWQNPVSNGEMTGTSGMAKRIEAIRIKLSGPIAETYDVYYRIYSQTYGWLAWTSNDQIAGTASLAKRAESIEIKLVKKGEEAPDTSGTAFIYPRIRYQAQVQTYGWQKTVDDNAIAGTVGRGKRMETLKVTLPSTQYLGYEGGIQYRTFVQSYGWQNWVSDGAAAGTVGQAKRIEALQIQLTGDIANYYDVYYSVHMAKIGWVNYACNGEVTGSTDLCKAIQAIKIQLVPKDSGNVPDTSGTKYIAGYAKDGLTYSGEIKGGQVLGNVVQGDVLGTTGRSLQLSKLAVQLNKTDASMPDGGIQYSTHISGKGWIDCSENGNVNGSEDADRGMEAFKVSLSGDISKYYDVYYRAYVQKYGWLGWAKNGQPAGTSKNGYRLEALQIKLISKDASHPNNSGYYTEEKKIELSADQYDMLMRANMYSSPSEYTILVNRDTHHVGIFTGGQGQKKLLHYWECGNGKDSTPTVSGVFSVGNKGYYFDSGNARCYWFTQFHGNYLFHSVLYYHDGSMMDPSVGVGVSHGCVRLQIDNAKWIYDNVPRGTTVVVY